MLIKERIIGVGSITAALEKVCQFHKEIDVIIVRIHFLLDIYAKQLIHRICEKLRIKEPLLIGYYTKEERKIKENLEKSRANFRLIEYDENDAQFPEKYISTIKEVYPKLNYDLQKAKEIWLKKPEPPPAGFVDPRKWLEEQGFVTVVKKVEKSEKIGSIKEVIPIIQDILKKEESIMREEAEEIDYKKLYLEMKEKYEQLSKYVKELINSTTDM